MQWTLDRTDLNRPEWIGLLVVAIVVAVFVFVVLSIVLNSISRGALIGMVREVEESDGTTVRSGWKAGASRMLSMIGIDLLTGIPAAIVALTLFALAASPLLLLFVRQGSAGRGEATATVAILFTVLFELGAFAIVVIGFLVLSMVVELAYRRCVLENEGVVASLRGGWNMLRANKGKIAGLWLVLIGTGLVAGLVTLPVYLLVFGLAGGLGTGVYLATESTTLGVLAGLLLAVPGMLAAAFVSGLYQAFQSTAWTLGYSELDTLPVVD
jgi:hypothetical protein